MKNRTQSNSKRRDVDPLLEPRNLESLLSFRLTNLSRKFAVGGSRIFQARFGVNSRELRTLLVLGSYGKMTSSEIADVANLDKGTISRAVKALMKRDLIVGNIEEGDLRRSQLQLTTEGQAQYQSCFAASKSRMLSVLDALTPSERGQLASLLDKVENRLDDLNSADPSEPAEIESSYLDT